MANRDMRFVAVHRGGPLEQDKHQAMVSWAADCAEHVLSLFENSSSDKRPYLAIGAIRAWARSEVSVGDAREAAFAAHAAAREADDQSTIAAARACGHAVATAHMADHCLRAVHYALKAVDAADRSKGDEVQWQVAQLPPNIKPLVISGFEQCYPKIFTMICSIEALES